MQTTMNICIVGNGVGVGKSWLVHEALSFPLTTAYLAVVPFWLMTWLSSSIVQAAEGYY